ncbi:MAG: alpha/beta hydrolase [Bacilli bacterium]|jgi:acetyl esterase/lipase
MEERYYRKTFMSRLINALLWLNGTQRIYDSVKLSNWFIDSMGPLNALPYRVPRLLTSGWEQTTIADTVCFIKAGTRPHTIFFLHGGGYTQRPTPFHFTMLDLLIALTGASVIMPLYPLAPNYTYETAYDRVTRIYEETRLIAKNHVLTLMGDSAGGGLSLGLYFYLHEKKLPLPDKLVLIAPFLDITMKNPGIAAIERRDRMLGSIGLIEMGKRWAGTASRDDYRLSPINGDLALIDEVMVIAGTQDVLYPDCELLVSRLRELQRKVVFIIGTDLPHDYPLMPTAEAKAAVKRMAEYVLTEAKAPAGVDADMSL